MQPKTCHDAKCRIPSRKRPGFKTSTTTTTTTTTLTKTKIEFGWGQVDLPSAVKKGF